MMTPRILLCLFSAALLSACAAGAVPVVGVPGPNKTLAGFQKDEQACRAAAGQAAYPQAAASGKVVPYSGNQNVDWQQFFTRYATCQAAHGNTVQPVPWAVAYAAYLGYGLPYPVPYPAPYPPPVYPYPYPYGYGYP